MANHITDWLQSNFDQVSPYEFYRDIFPLGELDKKDSFSKGMYTGIAVVVTKKKEKVKSKNGVVKEKPVCERYTVTDELDNIDHIVGGEDFCIMAPLAYAGKRRTSENARMLYAMVFDLDGIIIKDGFARGLENLWFGHIINAKRIPMPTYIVSSGTGVHLYYVFDAGIPLFPNVVQQLQMYKHEMTEMIWNEGITTLGKNTEDIQQEGIYQAFRMPGSVTKGGERCAAYLCGEKVDMEYMNSFVFDEFKVKRFSYKSVLPLAVAKEKYPDWYERRVVEKKGKKQWEVNRNLYDWWKKEILHKARVGHRYYCMMMLAVYAQKCSMYHPKKNPDPVTRKELEKDCFEIMDYFETLTTDPDNHFDEIDVQDALEAFEERYMTYPRNSVAYKSGIEIKANKRNKRKQKVHLAIARATLDIEDPDGSWRNTKGAPKKEELVVNYIREHPDASVSEVARAVNVSRPTVYKYLRAEDSSSAEDAGGSQKKGPDAPTTAELSELDRRRNERLLRYAAELLRRSNYSESFGVPRDE